VEVYRTVDTEQELLFKVSLKDGVADLSEVPEKLKNTWLAVGIPFKGKPVKPDEGELFLRAIASDFNGSMVRSNDPIEE
jgi:hypothetical protein